MSRQPLPLANVVTLGVENFDAQREFYRRLGWPQAFDSDDFAVFELRGALLALFPVEKLAADAHARPDHRRASGQPRGRRGTSGGRTGVATRATVRPEGATAPQGK